MPIHSHTCTCVLLFCVQAVKQKYESEPVVQPLPVSFAPAESGEDMKLQLDLEEKGVTTDGWHIMPAVFPAVVSI